MLSYHLSFFLCFVFFPLKNIPFSTLKILSTYPFLPHFDCPTIKSDLPRNRTRLSFPLIKKSSPIDYFKSSPICRRTFNNNSSPIGYRTRLQFGPDFLSCSNKGNRVQVDIRVQFFLSDPISQKLVNIRVYSSTQFYASPTSAP